MILTCRIQPGTQAVKHGCEMRVFWNPETGELKIVPVEDPERWAQPDFEAALAYLRNRWPWRGWKIEDAGCQGEDETP